MRPGGFLGAAATLAQGRTKAALALAEAALGNGRKAEGEVADRRRGKSAYPCAGLPAGLILCARSSLLIADP